MVNLKECGDCTACCDGFLIGEVYGKPFGCGKPCEYMVDKKCTIYDNRPPMCKNYQCAWTQEQCFFPDWMKPNISNVLVSIENDLDKGIQYLKVTEMSPVIDERVKNFIEKWVEKYNTYYELVNYEQTKNKHRIRIQAI